MTGPPVILAATISQEKLPDQTTRMRFLAPTGRWQLPQPDGPRRRECTTCGGSGEEWERQVGPVVHDPEMVWGEP